MNPRIVAGSAHRLGYVSHSVCGLVESSPCMNRRIPLSHHTLSVLKASRPQVSSMPQAFAPPQAHLLSSFFSPSTLAVFPRCSPSSPCPPRRRFSPLSPSSSPPSLLAILLAVVVALLTLTLSFLELAVHEFVSPFAHCDSHPVPSHPLSLLPPLPPRHSHCPHHSFSSLLSSSPLPIVLLAYPPLCCRRPGRCAAIFALIFLAAVLVVVARRRRTLLKIKSSTLFNA
ncbi:hypothetical protein C8R47DRAFT_82990 [Mycena vitilis]|nr:hypothetical protein C8R47DRAFT_82990 [Mycena vitilis]